MIELFSVLLKEKAGLTDGTPVPSQAVLLAHHHMMAHRLYRLLSLSKQLERLDEK